MSDEDRLLGHEYDGIREYDNPLPGWWSGVFIVTIVFAIGYWIWFHAGGPGTTPEQQFERDWGTYAAWKAEADKTARIDVTEELLATMATDPAAIEAGAKLFAQNCVGCHLADGSGSVGPNLTDDYQIHGIGRIDLYRTIRDGVPAKGMIAWGPTLAPRDVAALAAFVASLRGQNLPGKSPEGGRLSAQR